MPSTLNTIIDQVKQLPPEQLPELIKEVEEIMENGQIPSETAPIDYRKFFGSGTRLYADADDVVDFIRMERDAWED
jgi:hypothetical protein